MQFTLLLALATGVLAAQHSPLKRQTLEKVPCREMAMKECGDVCIILSDTCCPNRAGGCPIGSYCNLASDGDYNCCPLGSICGGPGGATTYRGTETITSTIVDTATLPPPPVEEPTEVPEEPTEVPEQPEEPSTEIIEPPPEETVPPVDLPSPIPTNGTGKPTETETEEPPVITGAAAVNVLGATNLIGGIVGVAALLL